ncbi:SIR2 family protein [Granulicella sp. L46]|uniref:SIR2 family protein n=1 Tax=Granulicella sp. L46 TaxID=1641865 RepID=UPI00131ADDFA|nr:SIR2 family protein [Granulicella sp. L46]
MNVPSFFDEKNLVSRLTRGLVKRPREVVLLVGSPLSVPVSLDSPGVPGVQGMIEMIQKEFVDDSSEYEQFNQALIDGRSNSYQAAFNFLLGTRGQSVANEIVREAVIKGLLNPAPTPSADEECRRLEGETSRWWLSPGTTAIGDLCTAYPQLFGKAILTTNFDPMLEVSIRRAGGTFYRTSLHADGYLSQTEAPGCHVVHLHGYWYGADTLHTARQLIQDRPRLKASLLSLLRDRLLLISGYGGWDDVFTSTLLELVRDDSAGFEVLWAFHSKQPQIPAKLLEQLEPGITRGRISLYSDIDCNLLFQRILLGLAESSVKIATVLPEPFQPIVVSAEIELQIDKTRDAGRVLEGDDEDRPPLIDVFVGRETEFSSILESSASVIFITGMGGEGKSAVAAKYFAVAQDEQLYRLFIWRDCKEEGERFETQLAQVIEVLSQGEVSGRDLANQDSQALIDLLLAQLASGPPALFVFDNVDHYVNLEESRLAGGADKFVKSFLNAEIKARVIFTCRSRVAYAGPMALSIELGGIPLPAAYDLFEKRGSNTSRLEVEQAHAATGGHALWLDLMALQVVKRQPPIRLQDLVNEINAGKAELPDDPLRWTLSSIWRSLNDPQRLILRAMAETVRPETDIELSEYLREHMTFNRFGRSLRALRSQNLIVVKEGRNGQELIELHPVVRKFVRMSFSRIERIAIISAIVRVYERIMGISQEQLRNRPGLAILQRWSQAAELDIEANNFGAAIKVLAEISTAFAASAYMREYVRVVRLLLNSFDWVNENRKHDGFVTVFDAHIDALSYLGAFSEVDGLLDQFEQTVQEKDAKFVSYCAMRCHTEWVRGEFSQAVEWGRRGRDLEKASGSDGTSGIAHRLALAERDAGAPELALPVFLGGVRLSHAISPGSLDEERDGAFYGNVGRCLDFMGQIDTALICYQKSAILIEKDARNEHVMNQGYIRRWIGELLLSKGDEELGAIFLEAARRKWEFASPQRASQIEKLQLDVAPAVQQRLHSSTAKPEEVVLNWIKGKSKDWR